MEPDDGAQEIGGARPGWSRHTRSGPDASNDVTAGSRQQGPRAPDDGAQRISVELLLDFLGPGTGTLFGHDGPSNVQTFMIWRQTGS